MHWLKKIEALQPGDKCEFHYPARKDWLPGTVVKNGMSGYWSVRDDSDAEMRRGQITTALYIEMVRLSGQAEAWKTEEKRSGEKSRRATLMLDSKTPSRRTAVKQCRRTKEGT